MARRHTSDDITGNSKQTVQYAGKAAKLAKKAKAAKAAKSAASGAKSAASAAASGPAIPVIAIIIAVIIFFLILSVLMAMVPSTSFNSMTHINEIQDEIDDDERREDGSINGLADGKGKALEAESEGVNLLYNVLKKEEEGAYDSLKAQCDDSGANYEATLAFMHQISSAPTAADIFGYTDSMEEGVFTQDQMDVTQLLSTYSISTDNLWEKDYLGDPSESFSMNLESIDISDMEGKAKYIYVFMRNKGLTHNQACGLLGNIEKESSFNPKATNGTHWGIVQWGGGRYTRLKKFAKNAGKSETDFKTQVEYIWEEFQNAEKKAYKKIKATDTLKDATMAVAKHYERCGTNEYGKRYDYALKWDKKFRDMTIDVTGGVDDRGSGKATKVTLGQACGGDRGKTGNKPGDQSGHELATGKWGYSSKAGNSYHWVVVIRLRDINRANLAARVVKDACDNNNIGYDQAPDGGRGALNKEAKKKGYDVSKITKKMETSCTPLVCLGVNAAGIPLDPSAGAENLLKKVKNVNKQYKKKGQPEPFLIYTSDDWTKSKEKLRPGDILNSHRHSAMVVSAKVKVGGQTKTLKGASTISLIPDNASSSAKSSSTSAAGANVIVDMAKKCAWPYGTKRSIYSYPNGKRTDAYTAALTKAYGKRSSWSKQTRAGASCDVFVGTVIRASGYDKKFPRGLDQVVKYCKSNTDKWTLTGIKNWKEMKAGDVLFQTYKGGGGHILIYLGNGKVAQAGYHAKVYGHIAKASSSIHRASGCKVYNVYRPAQSTAAGGGKGVKGALAWAKQTANDNSYTYGGSQCHQCNSKYAKQYVCTTFVKAAYAHGAGDSEVEKWCKNGSYGFVNDLEAAMKKSKNWMYVGKFSKSKLQAGDVVFKGSQHVVMYYGDGKLVAAHGRNGKAGPDQISIRNWYSDSWTSIYRYVGNGTGGGGVAPTTYKKYTVIKEIKADDLKSVCKVSGKGSATCPQSFAYMGDNTFAVAFTHPTSDSTACYVKKYRNKKNIGVSNQVAGKLKHANGLTYNKEENALYSVSGFGSNACYKLDASSLSVEGKISMANAGGSIAYDETTKKFYLGSGDTIRVLDGSLKKRSKTINKMGAWRYAQDNGGKDGIVYSCVCTDKSGGKNRINMYSSTTGAYYGTYTINKSMWEIESIDVDESGHLLILINKRGDNTDHIYRTKEALALDENGGVVEDEEVTGEPGNWRYDMPNKLRHYISGERASGNDPLYEWSYVLGSDGEPYPFEGVYDTTSDLEKVEKGEKIVADATDAGKKRIASTKYRHKVVKMNKKQAYTYSQNAVRNNENEIIAKRNENARKRPKLKKEAYLMATLKKKDVVLLGMNAFGVTNKKIRELYGPNVDGSDVVTKMAMNSLALLHSVNDFSTPLNAVYDNNENPSENFDVGKLLGSFEVETFCGCNDKDCKEKREALIPAKYLKKMDKLYPGSSCFVSDIKDVKIPDGTLLYNDSTGILVVEGHLKASLSNPKLTGLSGTAGDAQIVIYGGKNHRNYLKIRHSAKAAAGRHSRSGVIPMRLATGVTKKEARAYTKLLVNVESSSGVAGGAFGKPMDKGTFTSPFGQRWGRLHAGIDIGVPVGTSVKAANGGTVTRAGWFGGYGYCVDIDHGTVGGKKILTRYGHLDKILVKTGQKVGKGQEIAKSGNTGRSTGAHLHYEVHENGKAVDPLKGYTKKSDW